MPRSAASAADFVHLFWLVGQLAYVIGFSARLCHNLWLPLIRFVSRFTLQMPQIVRHPFNVGTPTSVRVCQKLEVSGFMCIFSFSFRRHMHARGTGLRCRPRKNDTTKDNASWVATSMLKILLGRSPGMVQRHTRMTFNFPFQRTNLTSLWRAIRADTSYCWHPLWWSFCILWFSK